MKNLCKILLFYNIFLVTENDNRFAPGTESNGNPWDNPNRKEEEPYQMKVISNSMTAAIQGEEKQKGMAAGVVVKTIIALIVCGALIFGGKAIVSVVMPEGEDITDLLKNDAAAIASQLGDSETSAYNGMIVWLLPSMIQPIALLG